MKSNWWPDVLSIIQQSPHVVIQTGQAEIVCSTCNTMAVCIGTIHTIVALMGSHPTVHVCMAGSRSLVNISLLDS